MPRPVNPRKIVAPPRFRELVPSGAPHGKREPVEFLYEEYEALKLADYDNLNHKEAADLMGISRPTFARIYENARRKIARAMVEIRPLATVYGNAYMDNSWYYCKKCHARFTIPGDKPKNQCPVCKSTDQIELINPENEK